MTLTLPSRHDEDWRWTDLSSIDAALAARPAANDAAPDHSRFVLAALTGPVVVFVDGRFVPSVSRLEGIVIGGVPTGTYRDLCDLPLVSEAFTHHPEGVLIRVESGHAAPGTVQIIHIATGGQAHLAHRIELGEDSQASIVETYVGAPASWTNVAVEITLDRSARLMRTVRRLAPGGTPATNNVGAHSETLTADVGQAASYQSTWLLTGADGARVESAVTLSGEGAFAAVDGVVLARDAQVLDIVNRVRHAAPGGSSRQTWRSVADDKATASFAGRVEVTREGQQTDAEQSVKGLLLKRTATINAKPELEIFADDVKCAHGATVGELSRDALFYLESRGIAPEEAKALLTEAFLGDALGLIGEESVREALTADAVAWLRGDA